MNTPKEHQLKPATTFEEQLEILRKRNLVINDDQKTIAILERLNYYRFSAYTLSFKEKDRFFSDTTFETLYAHYEFDMKLRILLLEIIQPIEIAFRTHIAYLIAHNYGPEGHLKSSNFYDKARHSKMKETWEDFLNNAKKDPFIKHHKKKYGNKFPVWVAIETVTFGFLSKLFQNMKKKDKKELASRYYKVHWEEVESWLRSLTVIRNKCAHHSRLLNQKLTVATKLPAKFKDKSYKGPPLDAKELFSTIIVMKHLSPPEIWRGWSVKLESLLEEYNEVKVDLLGFTPNWKEMLYE